MGRVMEKVLLSLVINHGVLMVEKAVERDTVSRKDMIMHRTVQKEMITTMIMEKEVRLMNLLVEKDLKVEKMERAMNAVVLGLLELILPVLSVCSLIKKVMMMILLE